MWAQPIRSLACYVTPEDIRARRAEDEGRTEMGYGREENTEAALGGGWEQDSGDEETDGPGKTGDSSCSLFSHPMDCQLSQIHILLLCDSLQ